MPKKFEVTFDDRWNPPRECGLFETLEAAATYIARASGDEIGEVAGNIAELGEHGQGGGDMWTVDEVTVAPPIDPLVVDSIRRVLVDAVEIAGYELMHAGIDGDDAEAAIAEAWAWATAQRKG